MEKKKFKRNLKTEAKTKTRNVIPLPKRKERKSGNFRMRKHGLTGFN